MSDVHEGRFVPVARVASLLAGVGALASLVLVLGGEVAQGEEFMGSPLAVAGGWLSFLSAAFLVLGLAGLAVRFASQLSRAGAAALGLLVVATAVTVGAASTLALVVPTLVERAPEIAADPPPAVPASFILSGLVMGVSGIIVALALRKAVPSLPRWSTLLLIVASVVTIVPLPSRYFLLGFSVAALLSVAHGGARVDEPEPGLVRAR